VTWIQNLYLFICINSVSEDDIRYLHEIISHKRLNADSQENDFYCFVKINKEYWLNHVLIRDRKSRMCWHGHNEIDLYYVAEWNSIP
jgi:hypothetical protein